MTVTLYRRAKRGDDKVLGTFAGQRVGRGLSTNNQTRLDLSFIGSDGADYYVRLIGEAELHRLVIDIAEAAITFECRGTNQYHPAERKPLIAAWLRAQADSIDGGKNAVQWLDYLADGTKVETAANTARMLRLYQGTDTLPGDMTIEALLESAAVQTGAAPYANKPADITQALRDLLSFIESLGGVRQ